MKIYYYLPMSPAILLSAGIAACLFPINIVNAASPSAGCSSSPPSSGSWTADTNFDGTNYSHKYSYPNTGTGADAPNPAPLLLFFHGWGGSSKDCGRTCTSANDRGYATISLTGIAQGSESNSWNGFGSTQSNTGAASIEALTAGSDNCDVAAEDDRTCNLNAYEVGCYADCNGSCLDGCWWTTCKDSVQQAVNVLEEFLEEYCVDMDRIYAVGCSNGGMFTYELAHDERSAKYLAGISTQVGLPHYGYNRGPHEDYKIHHLGFWGSRDGIVPHEESASSSGCTVPCRTSEGMFFYTSSDCTMTKWANDLRLPNLDNNPSDYGIPSYNTKLRECKAYTTSSSADEDAVVVGCIFNGGHVCNTSYMNAVTLDFFDAHHRVGGPVNPPGPTDPHVASA